MQNSPFFVSCYDPVERHPIFASTVDQVTATAHVIVTLGLSQDAWSTVLGNMRHVQVIRQNVVASTVANTCCCCCNFICSFGAAAMHRHCNFLGQFSSDYSWLTGMLIIFQNVSPLCKMLVPFKHSTVAQGFSLYSFLIICNIALADLPNFGVDVFLLQHPQFLPFVDNYPSQQ
jgi:hypothetical protein